MDDKFVNGTMLNNFAKKLKSNIKSDLLGGKKLKYVTQAEYDLLTDDEKNDENIIYNITDVDIKEEFSGDYNDLENRPCYMIDDIPDAWDGMYRLPFSTWGIPEEDWYFFPTVSNPENPNVDISYRDMVRVSYTVPDLSLFENIEVYHDNHGYPKSGRCIANLNEYDTLEEYKYVENVYLFNDTKANPNTGLITDYLPCAMIVLEETIISGKDYDDTNISTTFPPGIYLHCGSDTGAKMGTITGVGIKKLHEEMIPSSFAKKDEVVMRNDVVHEGIYKVSEQYYDFRYNNNPPSMSTMIQFIDYKTANSGPSIQMISQEDYDALGDNIDPGTLYIIG
jgi:hypothetical protein